MWATSVIFTYFPKANNNIGLKFVQSGHPALVCRQREENAETEPRVSSTQIEDQGCQIILDTTIPNFH
jgi:hypothetical protein